MYGFSASAEQEELLEKARRLMAERIYPAEARYWEKGDLPEEQMRELQAAVKQAGLWAPHLPKEAGGMGTGYLTLALMNEILGRSPLAPRAFGSNAPDAGNQELLWLAATPEQQEKYLNPSVAGEARSAFAMTEPEHSGSDPTVLSTTAVLQGESWVINGHKWFVTAAGCAQFFIVMAVTDPEAAPHRRASMILVDRDTPGIEIVRDIPVLGEVAGGHAELYFQDCRVPRTSLLGERGQGFKLAQARLGPGRITHVMRWIGVMRRSFEMMLERARTRESRGHPLGEFQAVRHAVADSHADIESSRLLTLQTAWRMDRGEDVRTEISEIKWYVANALQRVVDRAVQVHGALGISGDTPLEAFYREARGARIYDGADEVHRDVVGRQLLRQST
jgi:acyl-CoA dehydrogenase